jgi:hypothetical protein
MKKKKEKKVIKNGCRRTKLNIFQEAGIPVRPYDWKEKLPELFLIVGLLEKQSAKEVVSIFRNLGNFVSKEVKNGTVLGFGGGVSELGELVEKADEAERATIREIVGKIFCGVNLSLLKVLEVPGKRVLCDMVGRLESAEKEDILAVMRTTGATLHGKSGRATRAKLVQLMLWDQDCRKFHIDFYKLGKLVTGRDDDVLKEWGCADVRATWGGLQGCKDEKITPWTKMFWEFGLYKTPCFCKNPKKGRDRIRLTPELKSSVKKIDKLWNSIVAVNPKHDLLIVSDVAMGLTCRVWRFMHHIVEASGAGNGEMAEIAARCQWDSVVTLEWLVERNEPELFRQYWKYSAGKTKATLERLRGNAETYGGEEIKAAVEHKLTAEIEEGIGIWEQLINEERGGWAKETTYDMAKELLKLGEYEIYFRRFSDIVHGTWRALRRYHMRKCLNPLHAGHNISWTGATHDAGMTVVHFGINMAIRAIQTIVEYMGKEGNPKWLSDLEKIEKVVTGIAKRDYSKILKENNQ